MWECGFEETPLLLIPRGERNRAEGGGSCGQQRFHSGSQQDGHAWGGLQEPGQLRGFCVHLVPQLTVPVRCWTSCTHLGSQQSVPTTGQAAAPPP